MHRVSPIKKDRPQIRSLLRFGALAVFAGLGAGCSADAVRLTDPLFTSSTQNQQSIVSGPAYSGNYRQPAPPAPTNVAAARPSDSQRQPLPEPPGQAYRPVQTAAVQPTSSRPQPYTPPKPYAASGQPTPLGALPANRVAPASQPAVTASAYGTYVVKPGDSLWSIANRNGTSVSALQSANNLSGNSIRSGQRLALPGDATAPVQVAAITPNTMNDASPTNPVPAPRRPVEAKPVAAIQPSRSNDVVERPAGYTAPAAAKPEQPITPAANREAAKPAEPIVTASKEGAGFRWPVQGRIISGFGKKPNGERNDGIDLVVPEGTSVKAAESGVVIYAGNELKSYGNLVLVRHENGWVSAYAHNKELLVKRGDAVERGQVISRAGRSGGVDTPQVHFELRKGATPVDPMQYLSDV